MKDTGIIVGMAAIAVIIGVVIFLNGGGSASSTQLATSGESNTGQSAVAVPFTKIVSGTQSKVTTRVNYLITSQSELSQLWKMIDAAGQKPTIDFTQNDVIALFAGEEPTAGYEIAVTKVEDGATRDVTITLTKPGGSCILAQSLTAPYQIVVFAKTTLSLTHKDETTTVSCLQ